MKLKPRKLKKGSTIAIISPSWGGPSQYPHILEEGLKNLKDLYGFEIVEYPTARMDAEEVYLNPEKRADDINNAFADKNIDGIFASIGGNDSIRLLPFLDVDLILSNPKIIMGFSDSSTFLSYLNYRGLVTFQGPSIMAGWTQMREFPYLEPYYREILTENPEVRSILPFPDYSEGYPPWGDIKMTGKVNEKKANDEGFVWLQGKGIKRGEIWGGCLEVVDWLKGTTYWPEPSFFDGKIYMIETSEEKPGPDDVGYSLRNLGMQGLFDRLSGIIIGRARDYTDEEKQKLYETAVSIVAGEFGNTTLPIIANMDFGHTDPNQIIPLGIETEINSDAKTIKFTEPFYLED